MNKNSEKKEKRCISCGKLLLDEKFICKRCFLKGRNKAGKIGGVVIGGASVAGSGLYYFKNKFKK